MDHKLLLAKCLILFYKERSLKDSSLQSSENLIKEALEDIQHKEMGLDLLSEKDCLSALKETLRDLMNTPHDHEIVLKDLLERVKINCIDNEKLYGIIEKILTESDNPADMRKSIINTRRTIERHLKDVKISKVLNQATQQWRFSKDSIPDTSKFLTAMWAQLEPIASLKTVTDTAIIDEVCLTDASKVSEIVKDIHVSITEHKYYKTGFQGLNRMLQGGIRKGDFVMAAALQHKYKTGLSQSIFNQIAIYNKPLSEVDKKPALVCFAFEDKTSERFQFMFQQMMYTQTRGYVDIANYSVEDIRDFILEKLSCNGFEIFIYRVDPSKWSFTDLFNRILHIESLGYQIEFCLIDYLEKLPTVGCNQSGVSGNDLLDLFTRVRTFFNTKGIACYTPHQLNVDSKKLIRGSVSEDKFVQALAGKGYYKGSSQLDQIPDLILLTHTFQRGKDYYLAIQRDRHRISTIVDDKYKMMYLKFPDKMPIPDDYLTEDSTVYKLPAYSGNVDDDLYSFD